MSEKQRGFTLVEVMVAITIILLALIPIFGSMTGVLVYHRNLLDREIALGIVSSLENVLEAQTDFYVEKNGKTELLREISDNDLYPLIIGSDTTGTAQTELSFSANNKTFVAKAYASKNPAISTDIPVGSCSHFKNNPYLFVVKMVVSWTDVSGNTQQMVFVRRFYKARK